VTVRRGRRRRNQLLYDLKEATRWP